MKTIEKLIDLRKTKEILEVVKKDEKNIRNWFNNELKTNNLVYDNKLYPLCINPIILEKNTLFKLNEISENFVNLMIDSVVLLKENKKLAKKIIGKNLTYKLLEENLYLMNPEEIKNIFYRLDGIVDNNDVKIIEANMNSPGGIFTLEKMHYIGSLIYSSRSLNLDFSKGSEEVLKHFIRTYRKRYSNGELFLVVGKRHDEERFEHRFWAKKLRENRIPARTLDYKDRKIKFEGESLFYENKKVGVLYRRVFPLEFNKDIIESEKHGNTTILNPSVSYLLASKSMFALFHKLKNNELKNHKNFIENNVAETSFLSETDKRELITNKNFYVIKEADLNCGKGVYIGKAESNGVWENIVMNSSSSAIVQRYYEQPKMKFSDNRVKGIFFRKFDFSSYCIGEKVIMPYVRVNARGAYKSNNACGSSESLCYFWEEK